MDSATSIRDILDFWLLPLGDPGYGQKREMWWKSTPELLSTLGYGFLVFPCSSNTSGTIL